ncbi:MAG: alpha/beta hydrolase [Verrucomicrobiales bacterium]
MKKPLLVLALVCANSLPVVAQDSVLPEPDRSKVRPTMTEGIHVEGSMIFTYVDERRRRRLSLDLYRPAADSGPRPAIVMYFGGGWQNGRPGLFAALAQALAQRGYVCMVPEYRLSGEAPFPAAVHDAKTAIRWTRKNAARFGIDPDRIACLGGSAGGHLAGLMAATNGMEEFEGHGDHQEVSSRVQAAVVMCGPMDLLEKDAVRRVEEAAEKPEGHAIIDFLQGETPSSNEALYREASPLAHVGAHSPPMLFIDGEHDRPRVRYVEFWKKMDAHDIPHEFVEMPGAPHPFWVMKEWFEPTVDAVDAFLGKHAGP